MTGTGSESSVADIENCDLRAKYSKVLRERLSICKSSKEIDLLQSYIMTFYVITLCPQ